MIDQMFFYVNNVNKLLNKRTIM